MNIDISQEVYKIIPEHYYPAEEVRNRALLKNMTIAAIVAAAAVAFTMIYVFILVNENKKLKNSNQHSSKFFSGH